MSNEFVEKDSKIGYIIVIVVLGLIVLFLGGYIIYDNYIKDEKDIKVEEVDRDVVETRELSASEVNEYIEKIKVYNTFLYNYFLTDKKESISNDAALTFAYKVLMAESKDVTVENIGNVLDDYFGDKHNINLDNIICDAGNEVIYEYDKENNIYIQKDHIGHGGSGSVQSKVRYVSSKIDGNKVSLVTKNLYERYCSDVCGPVDSYYSSVTDMFNDSNYVLGRHDGESVVLTDELFESVLDKLPNTTYNFVIEDNGNFYLENVSIDK